MTDRMTYGCSEAAWQKNYRHFRDTLGESAAEARASATAKLHFACGTKKTAGARGVKNIVAAGKAPRASCTCACCNKLKCNKKKRTKTRTVIKGYGAKG